MGPLRGSFYPAAHLLLDQDTASVGPLRGSFYIAAHLLLGQDIASVSEAKQASHSHLALEGLDVLLQVLDLGPQVVFVAPQLLH